MLAELLHGLTLPPGASPVLEVSVGLDGRTAEARVEGNLAWSMTLKRPRAAMLLSHIVGTLAMHLRGLLFVHAGVAEFDGQAVILVGESGAGKTSTVAALVCRGGNYLSDEVAVLDPASGLVIPFGLPMAVKPWTRKAAGVLPPGRLAGRDGDVDFWLPDDVAAAPVAPQFVVWLTGRGTRPQLAPMSRSEMLLVLARQTSSFHRPGRVRDAFAGFAALLRKTDCLGCVLSPPAHVDLLLGLRRPRSA
jgi:hypothetical protein